MVIYILFQNGNIYSKLPSGNSGGRQAEALPPIPDDSPTQALLDPHPNCQGDTGGGSVPITDYSLLAKAPTGTYVHQAGLPDLINPQPAPALPSRPNINNNAGDVDNNKAPGGITSLIPCPVGDDEEDEDMIEEETEEQENKRLREAEEERLNEEADKRKSSHTTEGYMVNSAGYVQTPSPTSPDICQPAFPLPPPPDTPSKMATQNYVAPDMAPSVV